MIRVFVTVAPCVERKVFSVSVLCTATIAVPPPDEAPQVPAPDKIIHATSNRRLTAWTHNQSSRSWKPNGTVSTALLQLCVEIESHCARVQVNLMAGSGTCQQQRVGRSVRPQKNVGPNGGRRRRRRDPDPAHHGCA